MSSLKSTSTLSATPRQVVEATYPRSWWGRIINKLQTHCVAVDDVIEFQTRQVLYRLLSSKAGDYLNNLAAQHYAEVLGEDLLEESVAVTLCAEEVTENTISAYSDSIITEPVRSKDHVCFHDGYEYLLKDGCYYRAPVSNVIEIHTGNRGAWFETTRWNAEAKPEVYGFLFSAQAQAQDGVKSETSTEPSTNTSTTTTTTKPAFKPTNLKAREWLEHTSKKDRNQAYINFTDLTIFINSPAYFEWSQGWNERRRHEIETLVAECCDAHGLTHTPIDQLYACFNDRGYVLLPNPATNAALQLADTIEQICRYYHFSDKLVYNCLRLAEIVGITRKQLRDADKWYNALPSA